MTEDHASGNLTYHHAGVDIDAGNELVERIKPAIRATHRPGVLGGIGGFGGLFELPWQDYKAPVLVSGTDGVGTKLRLAIETGRHTGIGTDLVAMCVNDIVVTGAEPLFFLDYYATGKLDVDCAAEVVAGIAAGCSQAGAALIGGETAEMPGMYSEGDYDLAGFAVGLVEKDAIVDISRVTDGDAIIGLASSGPHSNGYSLIRKVLERAGDQKPAQLINLGTGSPQTVMDALLEPTRIYVKPILEVLATHPVIHALAHITGGGLTENIPRVLQPGQIAHLNTSAWSQPEIFGWLQNTGNIDSSEMRRVFNCGIGMVAIVPGDQCSTIIDSFRSAGETALQIGVIESSTDPTAAALVKYS